MHRHAYAMLAHMRICLGGDVPGRMAFYRPVHFAREARASLFCVGLHCYVMDERAAVERSLQNLPKLHMVLELST